MNGEITLNIKHIAIALVFLAIGAGMGFAVTQSQPKQTEPIQFYPTITSLAEKDMNTLVALSIEASNPCGFGGQPFPYEIGRTTDNNLPIFAIGCVGGQANG